MKVGDLVRGHSTVDFAHVEFGIIVGFNKRGEGGKDFVHVLCPDGQVAIFNSFDIEVVREAR